MSEIADIKRRLTAVSQTRQITNAMYLLSSTRMRREARRVQYAREYFTRLRATAKDILERAGETDHPYFQQRSGDRAAFLVIAGDKGLCGTYNSDVLKYAEKLIGSHRTHYLETVGRMATEYFRRKGMEPDSEVLGAAHEPTLYAAGDIAEHLVQLFLNDWVDEVYVVFTRFFSAVKYEPYCVQLLPLQEADFADLEGEAEWLDDRPTQMLYAPSTRAVFDHLAPQCALGVIFSALVQSTTSEHAARMNAMDNATRNADEMIDKLTREWQTQRQLSITNEIIEITSGAQGAQGYAGDGGQNSGEESP